MGKNTKGLSVIATQLPTTSTRRDIEEKFSAAGAVTKCHLVRDKEGVFKGVAYVVYSGVEGAEEAVRSLNNTHIGDSIIKVKLTQPKCDYEPNERKVRIPKVKVARNKSNRKGRLIVRNLSFKADEGAIREHFSRFGDIREVSVLRKKDGNMVGCAFVQFAAKNSALAAIRECNMKPLLGRTIAVDLAVPKEKFKPKSEDVKVTSGIGESEVCVGEVKNESDDDGDGGENEECFDSNDDRKVKNKKGFDNNNDGKVKNKKGFDNDDNNDDDNDSEVKNKLRFDNNNDDNDNKAKIKRPFDNDDDDDDSDYNDDDDDDPTPPTPPTHPPQGSRDVAEERTLFVKNLSFQATEAEIQEVMEAYGEVKYVLLCIDKLTQHPGGSAFVQFVTREGADACLKAESDAGTKHLFELHGRQMHVMRAISRVELSTRGEERKKESERTRKDNRNLYLAREGFVREGTLAADGVSKSDMAMRVKREQVKRRMLRNLHVFVSPVRLCVNNLPLTLTDKELRGIFKSHAPTNAKVTETRIMKNLKNLDESGKPVSRGYGFVSFDRHEHALSALRQINNNPSIFTPSQRPIVEFALENRAVLKARERREVKSRENNPLYAHKRTQQPEPASDHPAESFQGAKSSPCNRELPSNFGPKIRHNRPPKITRKQLRKETKNRAQGKKRKRPAEPVSNHTDGDNTGESKKKKKKRKVTTKRMRSELKSERSFTEMVEKYKKKIRSADGGKEKRWFED